MPVNNEPIIRNAVKDDLLCFLSTSRDSLTKDSIVLDAVAFYRSDAILKSKEIFFKICEERLVTRKQCASHPNPSVADVTDILNLFDKVEERHFPIPDFLASNFKSLPPANFEPLASVICSLRDEVAAIRMELSQVRESNAKDFKSLEDLACVKQDISDIKSAVCLGRINGSSSTEETPIENISNASTYANALIVPKQGVQPRVNLVSTERDEEPRIFRRNNSSQSQRNKIASAAPQPSDVPSEGGPWQLAGRKQRVDGQQQRDRRKPNVSGTRQQSASTGLTGVQRVLDLFVGGCDLSSTAIGITDYCKSLDVVVKKIEELPTQCEWYKAYKISLFSCDREKMLEPSSWPQGIFVRTFFRARVRNEVNERVSV